MNEKKHEQSAKMLCDAIRAFGQNPEALDNFEAYLSIHFSVWLEKFANTPESIATEFEQFSKIAI